MICKAPWKSCALPRTRRKSPGSKVRASPSVAFQSRAPTLPGLVAELQVEVQVALAVGPELLVGDEEALVDRVAVGQLIDVTSGHAAIRPGPPARGRTTGRPPVPEGRL